MLGTLLLASGFHQLKSDVQANNNISILVCPAAQLLAIGRIRIEHQNGAACFQIPATS